MKKIILLLIFILLLSGCEKNSGVPSSPLPDTPSASAAASPSVSAAPVLTPSPKPTQTPAEEPDPQTPQPTEPPPKESLLARASTPLLDQGEGRISNIKLAAGEVSGLIIAPGETFSFNEVVGIRSAEKGYEKAPSIVKGKKEMEYGGGVCQLATTIYQAADQAGLEIIERHNHQKDIGYAEKGSDAAVNYGTLDMKFKNNSDFPIKIAVLVGENTVNAEIYQIND